MRSGDLRSLFMADALYVRISVLFEFAFRLIIVDGNLFQVFRLEDFATASAFDIIDAVPAHQEFTLFMLTTRHKTSNPILWNAMRLSSPTGAALATRI